MVRRQAGTASQAAVPVDPTEPRRHPRRRYRHRHYRVPAGRADWSSSVAGSRSSYSSLSDRSSTETVSLAFPFPFPYLLAVASPYLLAVASPYLLAVPSPYLLAVPSPYLLAVPSSSAESSSEESSSEESSSADSTPWSGRNAGRFRCPYRCRSCRFPDFRRFRACHRRFRSCHRRFRSCHRRFRSCRCQVFRECLLQCRCYRRAGSSVPRPTRDRNANRREVEGATRDRQGPKPRPGHTGLGRTPQGRPTRRRARVNQRRFQPSRRHQPSNRRIR
jgi:hypothetical protein